MLQSLKTMASREGLIIPDMEFKEVRWLIVLGDDGKALSVEDRKGPGKEPPKPILVPRQPTRTSASEASCLADSITYVFGDLVGLGSKAAEDYAAFVEMAKSCQERTKNKIPAVNALVAFLSSAAERRKCLKRMADPETGDPLWVPGQWVVFAYKKSAALIHHMKPLQSFISWYRRQKLGQEDACCLCGRVAPAVTKHPKMYLPGAGRASLVSFDKDAFESYGKKGNENCPVCLDCSDAVATALDRCTARQYPHPTEDGIALPQRFVLLGQETSALFWDDAGGKYAEGARAGFEDGEIPGETIRTLFQSPEAGAPPLDNPAGQFYLAILSRSQGRAIVRSFGLEPVREVYDNLLRYFRELAIVGQPKTSLEEIFKALALPAALCESRDEAKIRSRSIAGALCSVALFGGQYPQIVLPALLRQIRRPENRRRGNTRNPVLFALLKAYLIRNHNKEITVMLDPENKDTGYLLGRLLAVAERIQKRSMPKLNRTLADIYFDSLSHAPGIVLMDVVGRARPHLVKLPTRTRVYLDRRMRAILDALQDVPALLRMEQKAQFALGYYQEQEFQYTYTGSDTAADNNKGETKTDESNQAN